ncbi:pyocin activator PrtN family protein [Vibrio splendidus]|uniref:Pyocin activator PrtN family protein n=1 Tax=Vibrio splendidus TaxID=29497 RepID=A0ABD5AFM3_VIBSP|nr:pyocin activator PrtN family protein [Vibrio splendidus]MDP2491844.1 pyocin activator PrtN family protein [Vibrio splendidus]PMO55266.1 hypothetical protein BCT08_13200 [Vibrio splendidus]
MRNNSRNESRLDTKSMLTVMFGMNPIVALEAVTEQFLDISINTAQRKARLNELPFATFRLGESQKSPWFVYIDDLAGYIDQQRALAQIAHTRANT